MASLSGLSFHFTFIIFYGLEIEVLEGWTEYRKLPSCNLMQLRESLSSMANVMEELHYKCVHCSILSDTRLSFQKLSSFSMQFGLFKCLTVVRNIISLKQMPMFCPFQNNEC
ncbi:hypothetical protein ACOSQ4_027148 [Xanthoceras sorbifolium]